jgi:hypothetical protein
MWEDSYEAWLLDLLATTDDEDTRREILDRLAQERSLQPA